MSTANPTNRLSAAPTSGCLPETDAFRFWELLQEGRLSANLISNHFPNLTDFNQLHSEYSSTQGQMGQISLPLLTALKYSYWNHAPAGPSAYDLTKDHLSGPLHEICRVECTEWGKARLNTPVDKAFYVVEDTPIHCIAGPSRHLVHPSDPNPDLADGSSAALDVIVSFVKQVMLDEVS